MTYESNLVARQQESTPELYLFTAGNRITRLTSFYTDVTFNGNTYTAAPIERGGLSYDSDFGSTSVQIKMLLNTDFNRLLATQPIEPTNIKIYRVLSSDTSEYVLLFNGQVKNVTINGQTVQGVCESRSIYLKKRIPKYVYQADCNHDIFDSKCALLESAWKVTGTVTHITGNTIRATEWSNVSGYADGYFVGGRLVFDDVDMRLITEHVDDMLTIQVPFTTSDVYVGISVDAYPGCDGTPETCRDKFNNLTKFFGMPYIPTRNPVIWGFQ